MLYYIRKVIGLSFSAHAKDELARIEARPCCRAAELAALIRLNGRIAGGEPEMLTIGTDRAAVARKIYKGLKEIFDLPARVAVRKRVRLRKNNRYTVAVGGTADFGKVFPRPGAAGTARDLRSDFEGAPWDPARRECCRRAYLRGAFLARGSVSNPQSEYHLEIRVDSEAEMRFLTRLMRRSGLAPGSTVRKRKWLVYLKDGGRIADCLNMMGAHAALLEFENARIYKEMRNRVNRLVNCDTANLNKTVRAGVRQEETIRRLIGRVGLREIPPNLRQVAELRLQQPDASLRELGEMARPPLSKSCVNHRLRNLEALARRVLTDGAP